MANDSTTERKTTAAAATNTSGYATNSNVDASNQSNALNRYRSFNNIFTLSALKFSEVNDPKKYRESELDLVILRSGGKGEAGIKAPAKLSKIQTDAVDAQIPAASGDDIRFARIAKESTLKTNQDTIGGFNKDSPGHFDMFIEDVEINSVMGFTENSSVSQPTQISFEVIEPFSINGFVEALQVSALAAGYPTYQNASFLLKIDFIGYPDDADFTSAEIVPKSSRYFPIKITGLEVSVDQRGTRYKVTAVPYNEAGFGQPSVLKRPVKIAGGNVKDILETLVKNINEQVVEADNDSKNKSSSANDHDEYKITFPEYDPKLGFTDTIVNKIAKSEVSELLKDNNIYSFPDAATVTKPTAQQASDQKKPSPEQNTNKPEYFKPTSLGQPVAQFPEGKNIHECIAAIIRDSKYTRNIVEKLSSDDWKSVVDDYGMIDYFLVKLEITNKENINADTKKPYQIFTYVVSPHKVTYTRIPMYGTSKIDATKLKKLSLREYNYVYTGKNVDVLNFKLNFNTLFFEAIPAALGKSYSSPTRDTAGKGNKTEPKSNPDNLKKLGKDGLPLTPQIVSSSLTSVDKDSAGQRQSDAYAALAKGMHRAIVDSKASMIDGELEILGDPYFLVTGGMGNYNPTPSKQSPQLTEDGMAAHNYGEVLVTVNFRNPIDIDTLEAGGRLRFDPELVPFSGIYRVNEVKSTFKDGQFKQSLKILRIPGQGAAAPSPSDKITQEPNKQDQISQDSTPAETVVSTDTGVSGDRASTLNLLGQLNRGFPSPGLPGELSNFTAATGGLGGTIGLTQVSGATSNFVGNTRLASQFFGGVVPDGVTQSAKGIPLQASGVSALQQQVLSPAALVSQTGNTVNNSFGVNDPSKQLANQIISKASNIINLVSVSGSGIGTGAKVSYTPAVSVSSIISSGGTVSAQDVISQASSLPTNITSSKGIAAGLGNAALAAVANLGGSSAGLVKGIAGTALGVTQGTSIDLLAVGSQFGINPSQLSGLSPPLQSKVLGQLTALGSSVPADTDLAAASAQGINLRSLSTKGLSKLPPTAPYSVSPAPSPDTAYIQQLASSGGPMAVAKSYGVNNINSIPQDQLPADLAQSAVSLSPSQLTNPFGSLLQTSPLNASILGSKYLVSNNQLAGITGQLGSVENSLSTIKNKFGTTVNSGGNLDKAVTSKFGSLTSNASPLDKLMLR